MKKFLTVCLVVCYGCCFSSFAQEARITPGVSKNVDGLKSPGSNDRNPEKTKCEGDSCEECPIMTEAMESLPKMIFKVGDQETCCHLTATRMAHEEHEKIVYVVGKKRYRESRDAFESLVRKTEVYVKNFIKPSECKETGTTTVAGEQCSSKDAIAQYSGSVLDAVKDMKLTYRVGEKDFDKYHDARRYSKKTHTKGAFVVEGEKYEDEYEARLALAHQRFKAAVLAIQQAKTQLVTEATETKSGTSNEEAG